VREGLVVVTTLHVEPMDRVGYALEARSGNRNTVVVLKRPRAAMTSKAASRVGASPDRAFQGIPNAVIGFNVQGRDNDQSFPHVDTLLSLSGLPDAETNPSRWDFGHPADCRRTLFRETPTATVCWMPRTWCWPPK